MKFISVIPARIGSKGIKNKNILKIFSKKLVEYTFEAAKKSKVKSQSSGFLRFLNDLKQLCVKKIDLKRFAIWGLIKFSRSAILRLEVLDFGNSQKFSILRF